MQKLCNGDPKKLIKLQCWAFGRNSTHISMGEFTFTIQDIQNGRRSWQLIKKKKNGTIKNKGTIKLQNFKMEKKWEFLDYIRGGEELCLVTAIDFTGSNGDPNKPGSLHNLNVYNQYQKAMNAVGQILLDYDDDSEVPMYGFGAKPNFPQLKSSLVQHAFPLTGNR